MAKEKTRHFGIRVEKSLIDRLEKNVSPLSSVSDLVRNILREWAKKNCENNAK